MAPRRPARVVDPPSASSSEDDEESEEIMLNQKSTSIVTGWESEDVEERDTDEETDDDEDTLPVPEKKSTVKQPNPAHLSPSESDDEEVDESDEFTIQDVASPSISNITPNTGASNKPLAASTKSKESHPQRVAEATQVWSSPTKLPAESKENRKETSKKKGNTSNGEEKSAVYWSLDHEIAVLEGMIDYQQTKRGDPLANAASFYDFIKKDLPNDVSKAMMVDKIKRLKKKYQNIAEKGESGGKDPVSTKHHDLQFSELSKKIWGGNVGITNNDSPMKVGDVKEKSEDFWAKYPLLEESLLSGKLKPLEIPVLDDEHFVKEAMILIGSSKASELEEEWKKLKIEELELHLKKLNLIHHQTQLMEEAYNAMGMPFGRY